MSPHSLIKVASLYPECHGLNLQDYKSIQVLGLSTKLLESRHFIVHHIFCPLALVSGKAPFSISYSKVDPRILPEIVSGSLRVLQSCLSEDWTIRGLDCKRTESLSCLSAGQVGTLEQGVLGVV